MLSPAFLRQACFPVVTEIFETLVAAGVRPMSVTRTLPYGTPDDVRADIARAMRICRGKASLVFFTSNTITPDIPLENVTAFWQAVRESSWKR